VAKNPLGNPDGSRDEAWLALQREMDEAPIRTRKRDRGQFVSGPASDEVEPEPIDEQEPVPDPEDADFGPP